MFTLFTQQDLEAVGARLTTMPGRYEAVHMAGEAGTLTLVTDSYVSNELQVAITKRVLDVAKLANSIDLVAQDQNLSTQGKANSRRSLETKRAELAQRLSHDAEAVDGVAVLARLAEAALYEPAALVLGDVAGALADGEIRSWFASRDVAQLGDALKQMTHRQLEALKRSPVPLGEPLGHLIDSAFEHYLESERAKEFASVQRDKSNASWGVAAMGQLRQAVERLAFYDVGDQLPSIPVTRPAPEARRAA